MPAPPTRAELEVLTTLGELKETPGTMLAKETLAKKWCGVIQGRLPADFERALAGLLEKGYLRENPMRTKIGFTNAGYNLTQV